MNNLEPDVIKAVDFHHYYGGGNTPESYIEPKVLDSYKSHVDALNVAVASSKLPDTAAWNSEAGVSPYNSHTGIEEAFVATFQLVDHLGVSAMKKLDVLTRQTFYGLWLGLIDMKLNPNPPYWFALLFKQLVGREVLNVTLHGLPSDQNTLRLYAHCTSRSHSQQSNTSGSVTVYGMNLNNESIILDFALVNVELYLLTADALNSTVVNLNGVPLYMQSDTNLPLLKPVMVHGPGVVLPPNSIALVVIRSLKAKACL